jgi:hypothetical protein
VVTATVDGGAGEASFDYGESLTDGEVGLGTLNGRSQFDDVSVAALP